MYGDLYFSIGSFVEVESLCTTFFFLFSGGVFFLTKFVKN